MNINTYGTSKTLTQKFLKNLHLPGSTVSHISSEWSQRKKIIVWKKDMKYNILGQSGFQIMTHKSWRNKWTKKEKITMVYFYSHIVAIKRNSFIRTFLLSNNLCLSSSCTNKSHNWSEMLEVISQMEHIK